jgi:hypothetical protein
MSLFRGIVVVLGLVKEIVTLVLPFLKKKDKKEDEPKSK